MVERQAANNEGRHLEGWYRKRFYLMCALYACCLFALVFAYSVWHLPTRLFGAIGLLLMVTFFIAFTIFFTKARARNRLIPASLGGSIDAATRERLRRSVRRLGTLIVLMPIFLVYGLLATSGEPLILRAFGAAVNLGLTGILVYALLGTQEKLRQPDTEGI